MSAQIIAALRKRADELDADAATSLKAYEDVPVRSPADVPALPGAMRWLAREFRALADEAEGRSVT